MTILESSRDQTYPDEADWSDGSGAAVWVPLLIMFLAKIKEKKQCRFFGQKYNKSLFPEKLLSSKCFLSAPDSQ